MAPATSGSDAHSEAAEPGSGTTAPELRFETRRAPLEAASGPTLRVWRGDSSWLDARLTQASVVLEDANGDPIAAPSAGPIDDPIGWLGDRLPAALDRCAAADPGCAGGRAPSTDPQVTRQLHTALAELRNPPIDFDALSIDTLRRRSSEKWATYPPDILPAWVAEMDFPLAEPVRRVLAHAAEIGDVGYPLGLRESGIQRVFSERMAERFGWSIDPERVEVLSEVVQAMHVAMHAYSKAGDGVVVQTPIYPPFLSVVSETRRRLVENRLVGTSAGYAIDFDALRTSIDAETRVAFLCNPHNPTGRVFRRAELETLAELAIERDWIVVMDEIHADLVFDGHRHIPFASLGPDVAQRTVTLTSASKAFNIPGLRCSVAHFGSAALQQRFNDAVSRHARGGLGLLGLQATVAAWQHSQPWLDDVRLTLARNRDLLERFFRERLPEAKLLLPEATYLAWIDFSSCEFPTTPGTFLAREAKVALSDGPNFGSGLEHFARLNFATARPILEEILERVAGAAQRRGRG